MKVGPRVEITKLDPKPELPALGVKFGSKAETKTLGLFRSLLKPGGDNRSQRCRGCEARHRCSEGDCKLFSSQRQSIRQPKRASKPADTQPAPPLETDQRCANKVEFYVLYT
ncbi:hypothetical protein PoB_001302200 [Plakobranchus ocellatus]|uniref:Uncharacterized protein n=1 Tax=Plakobranchus ocellatus TaxID=259542 RepID=A0AAV3YW14_9GAST|nr:hypothetical protein PoB_001302200 [Plakobranchus ocellatus]